MKMKMKNQMAYSRNCVRKRTAALYANAWYIAWRHRVLLTRLALQTIASCITATRLISCCAAHLQHGTSYLRRLPGGLRDITRRHAGYDAHVFVPVRNVV